MYLNEINAADGLAYFASRASGIYWCLPCDKQFDYSPGNTNCPACSADGRDDLAALYVEHDADEADMVQPCDFSGGD